MLVLFSIIICTRNFIKYEKVKIREISKFMKSIPLWKGVWVVWITILSEKCFGPNLVMTID